MQDTGIIRYNERVTAGNYSQLAERYLEETEQILESARWNMKGQRSGVEIGTTTVECSRSDENGRQITHHSPTVKASVLIQAPRAELFSFLSQPERAAEWDTTDLGFKMVEAFDPQHQVYTNVNKFPLIGLRSSVLFSASRPDFSEKSSLHCIRAIQHAQITATEHRPIYQQVFAWLVEDHIEGKCRVTAVSTAPEGMLPFWLLKILSPPGWRSILLNIKALHEQ
ncbi:MAG: hypothetical protein AAGD96_35855 [Chloroflexota bacterium]